MGIYRFAAKTSAFALAFTWLTISVGRADSGPEFRQVRMPAFFVASSGGEADRIGYEMWSGGLRARFTHQGAWLRAGGLACELRLLGARADARIEGVRPTPGQVNYLLGSDPAQFRRNLTAYSGLRYYGVYSGVDLLFTAPAHELKSQFEVAPGTDPDTIRFRYDGAGTVTLNAAGELVIRTGNLELREHPPQSYQSAGSGKQPVESAFRVNPDGSIGFRLGVYDHSRSLIVDPSLAYSSLVNGNQNSAATAIASDNIGNVYVAGWTDSTNFPLVAPYQRLSGGGTDAFIFKLNPAGNTLLFATYLGGSGYDQALALAIDSSGNASITGFTNSSDFPLVNAVQNTLKGGEDAFVARLTADGSRLLFSTLIGGSQVDAGYGVAVDPQQSTYVTGETSSTDFPTHNPLQAASGGRKDAFIAKFGPTGGLVYSTYLGGNSDDHGGAIAVDASGNAYVTGWTYSTNLPAINAFQGQNGGGQDAFVAKVNAAGNALIFSSYLGGSGGAPSSPEMGSAIAVDLQGYVYLTGTTSSQNFPLAVDLQGPHGYGQDAFVTKIAPAGAPLVYSTCLGGSSNDYGSAIAADGLGDAIVAGQTSSTDFPTLYPTQATNAGLTDAFVVKITNSGAAFTFATFLGGSGLDSANALALDRQGDVYVVGQTESYNFPVVAGLQPPPPGGIEAFVTSITGPGDHMPFMDRLYLGFLGRVPAPPELYGWSNGLDSGWDPAWLALEFFTSVEFQDNGIPVLASFVGVLSQDPSYASFSYYVPLQRNGTLATQQCLSGPPPYNTLILCSELGLINILLASPAGQSYFGGTSNSQFVTLAYQRALNRSPTSSELSSWVNQLNAGLARGYVPLALVAGSEFLTTQNDRLLVDMAYLGFLLRSPDPAGQQFWIKILQNGTSPYWLSYDFIYSAEFRAGI